MSVDSTTKPKSETHAFQAEVSQLLHLMVHSVYSEREVFLRELISNAADACDKLRYEALTHPEFLKDDTELAITLRVDKEAATLTVADNGIGMSREELQENLGTIARSGTRAFLAQWEEAAKQDKAGEVPRLIGQFGVGFYSAFMVADRVDVISRKAGADAAWHWSSDGVNGFEIRPADTEKAPARGTHVILHLKDDAKIFLEEDEIARIVRAYSDHISFPIYYEETGKDGKGKEKRQLNSASALWMRPKSEISADQYKEFYHHVSAMFDDPALTIHYKAEGRHEFTALLFIPSSRPFDLFDPDRAGRIRLYVRRVFITDKAELLPPYLRFVRGVIDSEDMPLNISREMLQNNPIVGAIRKAVTNKVLSELARTAEKDTETFEKIWEAFGAVIKEGLYEDPARRDSLYKIARFRSTAGEGWRSLKDYVADMPEKQSAIYYAVGESLTQLKAMPQLEGYRARGIEVLLLTDPVDNFWVTQAAGYEGKPFKSITQGDADLENIPLTESGDDTAKADKTKPASASENAALLAKLKQELTDEVSDVRASQRLVDSPACLVAPAGAPDRTLEKILARQAGGKFGLKPVMEVNLSHPLLQALQKHLREKEGNVFSDLAWLLLDEARILEGSLPADPQKFAQRLNRFLLTRLGETSETADAAHGDSPSPNKEKPAEKADEKKKTEKP